jgi:lipopolysaccharide biosynthesis glycosyltransferase
MKTSASGDMPTSSRERIALACAADAAYVRPLAAMVQSVLTNLASRREIDVFVLASGIESEDRSKLSESWNRQRATVHWLDARDSQFAGVPLWGRMPITTYYKLAVTDLLPADVGRVIFLDSDLIVLGDLGALWDADLGSHHLLAVQDRVVPYVSSPFGISSWATLGLDRHAKYFNAGVMVIDVPRWRRERVTQQVIEYLRKNHEDVYFWDQEGLNAVLAGRWGELDERWNCNVTVPGVFENMMATAHSNGSSGSDSGPWVLHYTGNLKPWLYPRDPRRQRYFDYLDQTPWAGWRPTRSVTGSLIEFYESSGLRRLFYPAEQLGMRAVRAVSRRVVSNRSGPT